MAATPLNPSKISKCCLVLSKFVLFSAVITLVSLYLTPITGKMSELQLMTSKMIQKKPAPKNGTGCYVLLLVYFSCHRRQILLPGQHHRLVCFV